MDVNTPASIAGFRAKSAADKVLSYMWYIHVLISVNTEARLRANIAPVLDHATIPASSDQDCVDHTGVPDHQDQRQPPHDLVDHLVLWLFNHRILARLIDTAPVFAQASGYAHILVDVPLSFRKEFCQRLYTLLFTKRIVEWPHGIDVPEPAIGAAEPIVVEVNLPVELEGTHSSSQHKQENIGGAGFDGAMEDEEEELRSPALSLRPATSTWLQTPSLSSWGGDDIAHMQRGVYFGTVSNPLPMNYLADWDWSRNGSGPQPSVGEHSKSGKQLKTPFPSPQKQSETPIEVLQTPPCDNNPNEPLSPPHARRQGRKIPSIMDADDIKTGGSEGSRRSASITTGSDVCRFGRGRMRMGHTVPKRPVVSSEKHDMALGWEKHSPAAEPSRVPAHGRPSNYVFGFPPSAERAEGQLALERVSLQNTQPDHRVKSFGSGDIW